ncbi:MAG: hypothetical protein K2L82_11175 [Lachnospiraceae bacterium]|nr:hypothetical protein [Lachnospiraceae bacterium]
MKDVIYSDWSKQVKKAMIDADLDTNDIADKFKWTRQYVSAIINGRMYQREAVGSISMYLGIEVPNGAASTLAKKKHLPDATEKYYGFNSEVTEGEVLAKMSEQKSVGRSLKMPNLGGSKHISIE